ncbi:MAG: galactose mutarotase [Gammaproteobacteria bacterium]|nr:galactose mutarotase [Gammaproteobacteria bacterium]
MKLSKTFFGRTLEGAEVSLFKLQSPNGLSVELTDFGATLTRLYFPDKQGVRQNLVLGYEDASGVINDANYFGATIGRCANRINQGKFELDGRMIQLSQNEGEHHLHGGIEGFNKKVWALVDGGEHYLKLAYTSADGDEGYPGELSVEITYRVTEKNELVIEYDAVATTCATPVNLTHHSYWNLAGAGVADVLGHRLMLGCERYLPVDEALLPTGEIVPVAGTPFDFRVAQTIGLRLTDVPGGYDHCFVRGDARLASPALIATVEHPPSGRVMTVSTTEPAVQFYTGNFLDGVEGADGQLYCRHGAFCLEAQHFPDSPNQPQFPSVNLKPGAKYHQTTIYRFLVSDADTEA